MKKRPSSFLRLSALGIFIGFLFPAWGRTASKTEEFHWFEQFREVVIREVYKGQKRDFTFKGIERSGREKRLTIAVLPEPGMALPYEKKFSADLKTGAVSFLESPEKAWKLLPFKVNFDKPEPTRKGLQLFKQSFRKSKRKSLTLLDGQAFATEDGKGKTGSDGKPIGPAQADGFREETGSGAESREESPTPAAEKTKGKPPRPQPVIFYEYKNLRYGYSLLYPPEVVRPQPEMDHGEGRQFNSPDNQVILSSWVEKLDDRKSLEKYFEEQKRNFTKLDKASFQGTEFLISGTTGESHRQQRSLWSAGILSSVRFECRITQQVALEPVGEKILKSFSLAK